MKINYIAHFLKTGKIQWKAALGATIMTMLISIVAYYHHEEISMFTLMIIACVLAMMIRYAADKFELAKASIKN